MVHQPVAAALDMTGIKEYAGGVYTEHFDILHPLHKKCSKTTFEHWMTLVGYGEDKNKNKFWKLKNNLGETWGDKGYLSIVRTDNAVGLCGVQS